MTWMTQDCVTREVFDRAGLKLDDFQVRERHNG